ncbi:MAG TPA: hypothetical protein VE397_01255, partial [Stellaceae bacterium]|nr:hypothetical protein [Stellaceae bacterium]
MATARVALTFALLLAPALPAAAQTVVGGVNPPSVTVDDGVLQSLGPPQTLPDLLRGRAPPAPRGALATRRPPAKERQALHRPKAKKRVIAKAKPKHQAPAIAAKKAAPVAAAAASETTPAAPRTP